MNLGAKYIQQANNIQCRQAVHQPITFSQLQIVHTIALHHCKNPTKYNNDVWLVEEVVIELYVCGHHVYGDI